MHLRMRGGRDRGRWVWGAIGVTCLLPGFSHAADGASVDADTDGIPEVVVTANKVESSEQRLPSSVTVMSGVQLQSIGITDLNTISQLAPSLTIEPIRTSTNIFLRGVGQTLTSPNSDPAVAFNVNGAYVPSEMSGVSFFDVDRVEVLPGPQGTLYGRNAAGGVINCVFR